MVSLGSGSQGIIGIESMSTTRLGKALKQIVCDSEFTSDEVAKELLVKGVFYCRLDVSHGLEGIGFEEWERLGDIKTHTLKYLEKFDAMQKINQLVQVLNQRLAIASTAEETLQALSKYLDGLISTLPGETWDTVISEFVRIVEPNKLATEKLNVQCALLRDTLESCIQERDFVELPDELKGNIRHLFKELKKAFQGSLEPKNTQSDPITHINMNIERILQRFWFQNHIAGNIVVHDILKYIPKNESIKKAFSHLQRHAMSQNLSNLNVAPYAAYSSSDASKREPCFKGTRVRLLNEIACWIASDDPSLPPIYVLDGVAGIGKSTIAQSISEHAAGINVLGASFFFSRNDNNRKTATTFFPTIAYQLAYHNKEFANQINDALLITPHVVTQLPLAQFNTLILEPMKQSLAVVGHPILVVIDALDECEHDGDVVLKIFADSIKNLPRVKLFITTRPEHHIRAVLDRYHHLKRFHLQDIENLVVQSDIRLYLDFHLSERQALVKLPDLEPTWQPAEKDIKTLVGICGTLFILASTAVKFVLDSKHSNPAEQLSRLLGSVSSNDFSGSKYMTAMDSFYTQILRSAVPGNDNDGWFGRFQMVVGSIMALQYPLPCLAVSALVDLAPQDVKRTLAHLHSLVAPTGPNVTFRIHHKSFPDFVTSPSRCEPRFLIDLKTRHLELGKRCLQIMDSHLKPNICNLGSADRFKDNSDTRHLTQGRIPQELVYASTHWASHLINASQLDSEAGRFLERFAINHFLSWLELLSIIGQMETAYSSLNKVGKLLNGANSNAGIVSRDVFHDGCRYIASNIEILKVAAGHVFSAFAFVPQDTPLFRTYGKTKGITLSVVSGFEKQWSPEISVMTGHAGSVEFVTFSGNGMVLASTSTDKTIRLWDGQTGAEITVLRGHTGSIKSLAFSPDGMKVVSGSDDRTVRLWDGQTGAEIGLLRGHSERVNSVAFSPDGTNVASASHDRSLRLWHGQTGAGISVLRGHWDYVRFVVFSPDGTKLASASDDKTVRLWDSRTGAGMAVLRGHSCGISSMIFSPDGTKLATSDNTAVRLWDGRTGAEIDVFKGRHVSVVFSLSSTQLLLASTKTLQMWDGQTVTQIAMFPQELQDLALFSPNGTILAIVFGDLLRLWDGRTGKELAICRGHSDSIRWVAFSPDATKVASASDDKTVRLWDGLLGGSVNGNAVQRAETTSPQKFRNRLRASVKFLRGGTTTASASSDEIARLVYNKIGDVIIDWVDSVTFSSDGTRLASIHRSGVMRLWNGQTGAAIEIPIPHFDLDVDSISFSPDGVLALTSLHDILLWNTQTGAELATLREHSGHVNSVVFSPDGTKLASASEDRTALLWDIQRGIRVVLRGHLAGVKSVVFSPNGSKLASVSRDRTVRLWDGKTGAGLREYLKCASSVVFSPNGTKFALTSDDGTVQLWDGQTDVKIASFLGSQFAAFTLDGSRLLSMNPVEFCEVNCVSGDQSTSSLPPGLFIESIVDAARVPGSNLWVILVNRAQPSMPVLFVVKYDNKGVLRFIPLCWFPLNLPIISFDVSSLSRVAVGCRNGRILLLDVDLLSLLQ